jgi:hypothetical protein
LLLQVRIVENLWSPQSAAKLWRETDMNIVMGKRIRTLVGCLLGASLIFGLAGCHSAQARTIHRHIRRDCSGHWRNHVESKGEKSLLAIGTIR